MFPSIPPSTYQRPALSKGETPLPHRMLGLLRLDRFSSFSASTSENLGLLGYKIPYTDLEIHLDLQHLQTKQLFFRQNITRPSQPSWQLSHDGCANAPGQQLAWLQKKKGGTEELRKPRQRL